MQAFCYLNVNLARMTRILKLILLISMMERVKIIILVLAR